MNNETPIRPTQDLLGDINVEFEYASTGQRFLNWLIDYVLMIIAFIFILGLLSGLGGRADGYAEENSSGLDFESYLVILAVYVGYYTLCESLFKGRTLGKLITGTRAVRTNNEPLRLKDAFLRSLIRIVPFEVFSGFGRPWHDSWTETMVVKIR
jgi:uncharacterized RDD family membrane protein YckC